MTYYDLLNPPPIYPCRVLDASGLELKNVVAFDDETGLVRQHKTDDNGAFVVEDGKITIVETMALAPLSYKEIH